MEAGVALDDVVVHQRRVGDVTLAGERLLGHLAGHDAPLGVGVGLMGPQIADPRVKVHLVRVLHPGAVVQPALLRVQWPAGVVGLAPRCKIAGRHARNLAIVEGQAARVGAAHLGVRFVVARGH